MIDLKGTILLANLRMDEMFGYDQRDLLGRSLETLIPECYRGRHSGYPDGFFTEPKARARGAGGDLAGRRKDGSEFPVEIGLSPIHTLEGIHVLVSIIDITDRKALEDELRLTREAAAAANQAKSAFLANISYELRTPLNGIVGMVGLLYDSALTHKQNEYCEIIKRSGDELLTVINEVLDFSNFESGKIELELIDLELASAVEEVTALFAEQAAAKGIELINFLRCDMPMNVGGDPGRLRQILSNLVGNTVEFTARGEVIVGVDLVE
jgi:PAS domain S-box-containing protein